MSQEHYKSIISKWMKESKAKKTIQNNSAKYTSKDIFTFRNKLTGETFVGSSYELRKKYNLNQGNLVGLVNGKHKSLKGWIVEK